MEASPIGVVAVTLRLFLTAGTVGVCARGRGGNVRDGTPTRTGGGGREAGPELPGCREKCWQFLFFGQFEENHKSIGFVVLALTAARLVLRHGRNAPPKPAAVGWENAPARIVQAALYALAIAAIVAGWLLVSTSPLPIPIRFFALFVVPDVARPDLPLFAAAIFAHDIATGSIACLVALHAAGALKHHFFDGDDVLIRMLPRRLARSRRER